MNDKKQDMLNVRFNHWAISLLQRPEIIRTIVLLKNSYYQLQINTMGVWGIW